MKTRQHHRLIGLLLLLISGLAGLAAAGPLPRPAGAAAGGTVLPHPANVITNPNFEAAWPQWQPTAPGYQRFGDPQAHFSADRWHKVVYNGQQAQLIGLKQPGRAGLQQRLSLNRGELYELSLHGLIRVDGVAQPIEDDRYQIQVGWSFAGQPNPNQVESWHTLPLPVHPRTDPRDRNVYRYGSARFTFQAIHSDLTLFVRAVHNGPAGVEANFDIDALSLLPLSSRNLLENGNFEAPWPAWQAVATGWQPFGNGQGHQSFYNDQWDKAVAEGQQSQLIELINDGGVGNRFAGIQQTVNVTPGVLYQLDFQALLRSDEGSAALSDNGYAVEYGFTQGDDANWQAVAEWLPVELPEYPRTDPAATNLYYFTHHTDRIRPSNDRLTLYIRGVKKQPNLTELNVNLDAVSLRRVDLIEEVTLDKTTVCVGEAVTVTVQPDQQAGADQPLYAAINGEWSDRSRIIRFQGEPGPRLINVVVASPQGDASHRELAVEVVDCPARRFLNVILQNNPYHPDRVNFTVANAAELGLQNVTYVWDFGDGASTRTSAPYVSHGYSNSLAPDRLYTVFKATVRVEGQPLTAHKTVTVFNLHVLNRQRGLIQPRITTSETLRRSGGRWVGDYTLENPDSRPIRLTALQREQRYCDESRPPQAQTVPLQSVFPKTSLAGGERMSGQVTLTSLPADVCAVTYHFQGAASDPALTVAGSLFYQARPYPGSVRLLRDQQQRNFLNQLVRSGLLPNPNRVTDEDLYRLEQRGQIERQGGGWTIAATGGRSLTATAIIQLRASSRLGDRCTPGQTPPRPGLSCQVTNDWEQTDPQFVNARKGDIVLSAGCGAIGNLLRKVSPPQIYSHTGIMIQDRVEIRHSTASTAWYQDQIGADGMAPQAATYGWPGTINQSVYHAVEGEPMTAPTNNKTYVVSGFNPDPIVCGRESSLIPPLVVKPPPQWEIATRPALHRAADEAKKINGHYRFFAYTNGAISLDPHYNAPASAGWAAGSSATVCTTTIWHAHQLAGNQLEGSQLELSDLLAGAELAQQGRRDGLYRYSEDERRGAASWLKSYLYDQVFAKAGWLGELLSDASDDLGNQLTNCFASDWCGKSAKDSERWRTPGIGQSVSPDNIMLWDSPAGGGVYGYTEPLIYRDTVYERVYRWGASAGTGTITGRITVEGQPLAGATVSVAGLEAISDSQGRFTFAAIPAGQYEIKASKVINRLEYTAQQVIEVQPGRLTMVNLILTPPPQVFRRVLIGGEMNIVDDETWPIPDEKKRVNFNKIVHLNPGQRSGSVRLSECVGDEVRVEVDFELRLLGDQTTVRTSAEARLYEGTACGTRDREDRATGTFITLENRSSSGEFKLRNRGVGGGDKADITFTIFNMRQP